MRSCWLCLAAACLPSAAAAEAGVFFLPPHSHTALVLGAATAPTSTLFFTLARREKAKGRAQQDFSINRRGDAAAAKGA